MIYGARVSMIVGFIPTIIILIVGTTVGMLAGYYGGRTDNLLMRFTDVVYAFPDLLFFIIVMVALRDSPIGHLLNGLFLLFIALAIVSWVGVARLVRGQVLSLKQKEFIEAARCIGAKTPRIMKRHLLPNTLGALVVAAAFQIPALSSPKRSWATWAWACARPPTRRHLHHQLGRLAFGRQHCHQRPALDAAGPGHCIALVVLAFTFLGDGLRDALDPRMRGTS